MQNSTLKSPLNNDLLKPYLKCIDHTVSRETFEVLLDEKSELLVTYPQPLIKNLGKYYKSEEYISHTDSNDSMIDKVYQLVRNYTINQKVKMINSLKTEQKQILDIGCGTGDFLHACKKNGWLVSGIEPNENARNITVEKLRQLNNDSGSTYIKKDISEITLDLAGSDGYDIITLWHVLEHIPNLIEYVSILKKLLNKNGILIIAVPNFKSYDAEYYGKYWAAYDVPRHFWHFSQGAIKKLFSTIQFEVVKIIPMKFDSYYVSLLSEKYKSGNSNPLKAFYRGFVSNWKAHKTNQYSSLIYIIKKSN